VSFAALPSKRTHNATRILPAVSVSEIDRMINAREQTSHILNRKVTEQPIDPGPLGTIDLVFFAGRRIGMIVREWLHTGVIDVKPGHVRVQAEM
jgi:hypothetical protein